jgi:signal transduction histidine kinase/ActR/RegA family two-component response regulator
MGGIKTTRQAPMLPTDAAEVMSTMLSTQYVRYGLIGAWAVGLWAGVGFSTALFWFAFTIAAGGVRSWVERKVAARTGKSFGFVFTSVALVTGAFWAAAPAIAWFSGKPFGEPLAIAFLCSGYLLVFTQLRNSPVRALMISTPYTLVSVAIAVSAWGRPQFWAFLGVLPFVYAGLAVHVLLSQIAQAKLTAFQDRQQRLMDEVEQARDRADAANAAKTAFLGVISHELRTPMNGVLGAAQLLDATDLTDEQRNLIGIIRNSGDNLLGLLNEILDHAKIEAGRLDIEAIPFELDELLGRVFNTWGARAGEKQLAYRLERTGDTPWTVLSDPTRLTQILHNLISNALKFTTEGGVDVRIDCERIADDRARMRFSVVDTGPGISGEDAGRLFQPFTQLDVSTTRRFGGTGLGLSIARKLARMMEGDLSVTSELGRGSTFTLEFEAEVVAWMRPEETETQAADETEDLEAVDFRPMKVLVVEDHPINRLILETWLTTAGHSCVSAENGELAVEACAVEAFDLVLMDVNMPVMDGLTATRTIRGANGPNQRTTIVVLSASAHADDHKAGLEAGADTYLNKPVEFGRLAKLMDTVAGGAAPLCEVA